MKEKMLVWYKKFNIWAILWIAALYAVKLALYKFSDSVVNTEHHIIDMKIDDLIPFCKYFVFFYFSYYWFSQLQLYLISYCDKKKFYRMIIATIMTCTSANIFYWFYQVKMIRPEIIDTDFFSLWVKWIYSLDPKALNCFPSIHAAMGTLMIIGGLNTNKMPKWLKYISAIFGIGCILSTVFIKQHYFIDVVFGVIFMVVFYLLVIWLDKKQVFKKF